MKQTGRVHRITKTTKALDAIRMSPAVMEVFRRRGLYCPTCKGIGEETIEMIAVCNGIDVVSFVDELNAALS